MKKRIRSFLGFILIREINIIIILCVFYEKGKEIFDSKIINSDIFILFKIATHINYDNIVTQSGYKEISSFCITNEMPYSRKTSSQQNHIAKLLNGKLNYRIKNYFLDIYLEKEKICVEYDGSSHNMSVMFGSKTEEEFNYDEEERDCIL